MSQPTAPWSSTPTYPTTPATRWAGSLTKVTPAFSYYVPGQTPTAQELNALLYNRDVAIANASAQSAADAVSNWQPLATIASSSCFGVAFDSSRGQWIAAMNVSPSNPSLYASQDGETWAACSTVAAWSGATNAPRALGVYLSGTIVAYCYNGAQGVIERCTQGAGAASTAPTQPWATRAGSIAQNGTIAHFFGATTPAMYFFGSSNFGTATGAWLGFAASDTDANDGAGTAGVWADLHASLPASFLSGTGEILKYEVAQSANTLLVALCAGRPGTDPSFLMTVSAGGTMTDVTPAFIGTTQAIRGIAYSMTDGLWGMVTVDASNNTYLYASADAVTWTLMLSPVGNYPLGLAVIRNAWALFYSVVAGGPDKVIVFTDVLTSYQQGTTPVARSADFPSVGVNSYGNGRFSWTIASSEVPGLSTVGVARQLCLAKLFGATFGGGGFESAFTQSLRSGYFDQRQTATALAPPAPGWNTALDIDFTKAPSATYAADGAQTIGGVTWTKSSSANDRAALATVNGSGLVFKPTIAHSGSVLYLPLTSFIPANVILWSTALRVWVWLEAQNFAASGDAMNAGILPSTLGNGYLATLGATAGPVGQATVSGPNGSAVSQNFAALPGASTNVMLLEIPALDSGIGRYIAGQYNSGSWPTEAGALYQVATLDAGTMTWGDPTGSPIALSGRGLTLNAQASATSTLTVTVGRIRVDYKL